THLLLQNEIPWSSTIHALRTVESTTLTFFNPSPMPSPSQLRELPWSAVNWLIVNEGEAQSLFDALRGEVVDSEEALSRAHLLLESLRALPGFSSSVGLVCTLGSLGVMVLPSGSVKAIYVPALKLNRPVVDTTGAGDCFTGYFVAGFMKH
ncbi:Ribokinase-like protein, partial [Cristinia sonorae]